MQAIRVRTKTNKDSTSLVVLFLLFLFYSYLSLFFCPLKKRTPSIVAFVFAFAYFTYWARCNKRLPLETI